MVFVSVLALLPMSGAAPARQIANYSLTGWRTLEMTPAAIVATGGSPVVKSGDGKLRVSAEKVILRVTEGRTGRTVSATEATGRVSLSLRQGAKQKVDATCRSAVILPAEDRALLKGDVKVTSRDPSGAMELASDAVTIYLKEQRIVATSSPKRSRLTSGWKPVEKP